VNKLCGARERKRADAGKHEGRKKIHAGLRAILEGVLRCDQAHSRGDLWHALARVQEGERGLPPDLYDTIRWFCQVTRLASGLKVASLVADIVEWLPDAALDPAILSEQS
jgi:hypothetical protein